MSDRDSGSDRGGETVWPVLFEGVTETVVTTLGPNGRWNVAALGLFAEDDGDDDSDGSADEREQVTVTATTWGNTRTRRNFHNEGQGYVQFTTDPVDFVDAALSITELEGENPILESADAWVRVAAERIGSGEEGETQWERWELTPLESRVLERRVPTVNRGFAAVIEASVAASRLGVAGYDDDDLERRLEWCSEVVERAGSDRDRDALERLSECSGWETNR